MAFEHPTTNVFVPARGRSRTRLREGPAGLSGDRSRGSKRSLSSTTPELDASRFELLGFLSRHGRVVAVVVSLIAIVSILMSLFPGAPNVRDLVPRDAAVEDNLGVFLEPDKADCPTATRQMLDGAEVVQLGGWKFALQGEGVSEPSIDRGNPAVRTRLYVAERDIRVVTVMVSSIPDGRCCVVVNRFNSPSFATWLIKWL